MGTRHLRPSNIKIGRIIDTDEYAKIKDEDICLVSDRIISDEKAASRKIGF